ncbi:MAG: polysaccharide pyruvyl transferase family protein [Ferruginibacter sp.]|nr:polysaccharide pyruvyl transferase family protein [Ferruginibacter sp.]
MKNVFLITKLKTSNLGNEVLSTEIIRLFKENNKNDVIRVNGRPMGIEGYFVNRIIKSKLPSQQLDKWAEKIASQINKIAPIEFAANNPKIILVKEQSPKMKWEPIKAKLRPLKRLLGITKVFFPAYQPRAAYLKSADWLVYSGAGEVGDNSVFLRQLLEIRVAQKLGVKTAAVNQSVVIKTPLFQQLTAHVYGKMEKIVIRGTQTQRNLIKYGVPENIIELAPDSAINATYNGSVVRDKRKIGFNLTPRLNVNNAQIETIIKHLESLGKEIFFITNEPFGDLSMMNILQEKFGIKPISKLDGYKDYMEKLASLDWVISARLHTNVLSLATGTPIIPVEGNVFKTTELMEQLQYPIPVIDTAQNEWVGKLLAEVDKLDRGDYLIADYFTKVLPLVKEKAKRNASWLNDFN